MKDQSLSVFGLGRVGCVSAACFAASGFDVTGVDVDERRIQLLNQGRSPITEPGLAELVRDAWSAGRLCAVSDVGHAVARSTVSIICLGTPGTASGELDLLPLVDCVAAIGRALKGTPHRHLVIVRSTVPPGTIERRIVPRLEASAEKQVGAELGVVFNPEFMREGSAIPDFHDPPLRVLAASDPESFGRAAALYSFDASGLLQLDFRTAEMLKLACNAFHAMKVAFANEVDTLCQAVGADAIGVMDALCSDRKLNLAPSYLKPGSAFGGSCLAKDIRALLHDADQNGVRLPLFQSILETNELRFQKQLEMVLATGVRRFGVFGLASKGGADDLRGSPGVRLARALHNTRAEVRLFDPCLCNDAKRNGLNDEHRAELGPLVSSLSNSLVEAIARSDLIVLTNDDSQLHVAVSKLATNKRVIDFGQFRTAGPLGPTEVASLDQLATTQRAGRSPSAELPTPAAREPIAVLPVFTNTDVRR